ncbi:MAG: hypothetical protein RMX65_025080 [Nostoc sp. DedQUE01]
MTEINAVFQQVFLIVFYVVDKIMTSYFVSAIADVTLTKSCHNRTTYALD